MNKEDQESEEGYQHQNAMIKRYTGSIMQTEMGRLDDGRYLSTL